MAVNVEAVVLRSQICTIPWEYVLMSFIKIVLVLFSAAVKGTLTEVILRGQLPNTPCPKLAAEYIELKVACGCPVCQ